MPLSRAVLNAAREPRRYTDAIGFDVTARGDFTLAVPVAQPLSQFSIFQIPAGLTYAEVHWLTVVGDPDATFLNNVTWIVTVTRAGPQEHLMQSIQEGVGRVIDMAGMRWGVMGSLQEPFPVAIRLAQAEVLGVAIVSHTALSDSPLTIYARASGVVFR